MATIKLDTNQLKTQIDARDLARELLGSGKRVSRGTQFSIDGQRTGSFTVYENGFYDFSTGESGDTFDLLTRLGAASTRKDAIEQISARVQGSGSHLIASATRHADPAVASDPPDSHWQQVMAAAVDKHHAYLVSGALDAQRARAYLQGRGISDDLILRFRLGYNPRWHKTDCMISESDGGKRPVSIPPGIVIPWFADDALWAVHVRCRDTKFAAALGLSPDRDGKGSETAKYKFVTGSHIRGALFNGDAIQSNRPVLFVEGEFDAMIAGAALDDVSVVTLGGAATHLAGRWRSRITGQAYVCLDGDQAGEKGAAALLKHLPSNTLKLELPNGKDVTDYHVSGGDLRAWFATATAPAALADGVVTGERYFTDGVPDSWRQALLTIDAAAALTYEVLTEGLRSGQLDPDHITIAALLETVISLGWGVSEATIRRGAKLLANLFLSDLLTEKESISVSKSENNSISGRKANLFLSDLLTEKESISVSKSENNSISGRKAAIWKLLSLPDSHQRVMYAVAPVLMQNAYPIADGAPDQPAIVAPLSTRAFSDVGITDPTAARDLAQLDQLLPPDDRAGWAGKRVEKSYRQLAFQLNNLHSTPLSLAGEGWLPRTALDFRVVFLRALKTADPNAYRSARQISEVLGVKTRKTAAALVRRAGLAIHADQFEARPITGGDQQVSKIARFEVQGKPRYIVTDTSDGVSEVPYSAAELTRQLDRGVSVTVKFQVANRHEVIPAAQPITRARRLPLPLPLLSEETAPARCPRLHEDEPTLGYSPTWVRGQLTLRLRRLGWSHNGQFINRETGEVLPINASAAALLGLLLGRKVDRADSSEDHLINFAIDELGAIPRPLRA